MMASAVNLHSLNSGPREPAVLGGEPFSIKDHQRDALQRWRSQDLQGILALATGAGKTITALYAATRLYAANKKNHGKLFLIIAVPYTDLADQWLDEAALFNIHAIGCYESAATWTQQRRTNFRLSAICWNGMPGAICTS